MSILRLLEAVPFTDNTFAATNWTEGKEYVYLRSKQASTDVKEMEVLTCISYTK